jgi:ABC-type polysaccharide/polyol phosphate transport system ATPase subunit
MSNETAIKVDNVSKTFKLPHSKNDSIKSKLISIKDRRRGYEVQQALKDISFEVKKGEFFGIVGRNGSGKSTLLKLIAGIYTPDSGQVEVTGKLTPFIELGVGFNPELSGRDNVFLNGALLGFSRKEMESMYDEIISFAELERFMDQKLKNYSSGMQVRLAFSIAIRAQSDILLIDEVLAVGDTAFQQKCFQYFDELKKSKHTIVLVTHDMGAVRQFCDRAMLVNDAKMEIIGNPGEVSKRYDAINYSTDSMVPKRRSGSKVDYTISNGSRRESSTYAYGEQITLSVSWRNSDYDVGMVGVVLYKGNEVVFATNTEKTKLTLTHKEVSISYNPQLGDGRYRFNIVLFGESEHTILHSIETDSITIYQQPRYNHNGHRVAGMIDVKHEWSE